MAGDVREVRHNVITISSITAFADVKGGIHDFCKDVYFIRALGTCSSLAEDVRRLEDGLWRKPKGSFAAYKRVRELPKMPLPDEVNACLESYQQWKDSREVKMFTPSMTGRALNGQDGQDAMPLEAWAEMLGNGCRRIATLFAQNTQANASQEKNFIVKLIYWLDWLGEGWLFRWDGKEAVKIVAENVVKKQEYFFYYLLTLLGMDVLLLQSRQDIAADLERLGLSEKFVLGAFGEAALPAFPVKTALFPGENQNREGASQSARADSAHMNSARADSAHMDSAHMSSARADSVHMDSAQMDSVHESGRVRVKLPERPGRRRESFSDVLSSDAVPSGRRATVVLPPRSGRNPSSPSFSSSPNIQSRMPGGARREMSFEELARLASSVVMITVHNPNGEPAGSGSGIMVGQGGYILTNHHVAAHGSFYSVSIEGEDKQYRTEDIIKYNSLYDLAVIRIDRRLHPLPVFKGNPPLVRGQKVVAIGSPLGLFNSVSDGIISGFRTIRDVDMIQFTAPISHGSSGGAVLNMFGEVIGISTAGIDDGQNINLAMGYEVINMFIQGFTS